MQVTSGVEATAAVPIRVLNQTGSIVKVARKAEIRKSGSTPSTSVSLQQRSSYDADKESYSALRNQLVAQNKMHRTLQPKDEKSYRIVIKGLHQQTEMQFPRLYCERPA